MKSQVQVQVQVQVLSDRVERVEVRVEALLVENATLRSGVVPGRGGPPSGATSEPESPGR